MPDVAFQPGDYGDEDPYDVANRRRQPEEPGRVEVAPLPTADPTNAATWREGDPWIPNPNATGASKAINDQNPFANPEKPYVQYGNTGGYLDGVGVTIGAGSSLTPDQAKSYYDAGVAKYGKAAVDDMLRRNPGDYHRIDAGLASETTGSGPDQQGGGFNPQVMNAIAKAQSGSGWGGQPGVNTPGGQFDDPYTKLFEDVAKQQLERLTGQNAEMDRLMQFIADQFTEKSTSQGYSPDEQALLRTQALEPIERDRAALNQRVLERTAARGFLPSSGLNELDLRDVDREAETRRTVAQRDLAVAGINKRQADLAQALQLAQLGLNVPNQQGQQAMSVANSLYQLPRNALMDSLAVLNASSPQSAISPMIQLQQQQQQQAQYQQAQTAAMWQQIGQILAGLF